MSFLEQALAAKQKASVVPEELLDDWCDEEGLLPVSYLLHPSVRRAATESDVREVLKGKQFQLPHRVSSDDFVRLAKKVHRIATSGGVRALPPLLPLLQQSLEKLNKLLSAPQWAANDWLPARVADDMLLGSARHAADMDSLRRQGVCAVLNCAPQACDNLEEEYSADGIHYLEIEAEDFDQYPLLEIHLSDASQFVEDQRAAGRVTLVHCFAGINRSAALVVAILMLRERMPLIEVVRRCHDLRPFILSNESFRLALVKLANEHALLESPQTARITSEVETAAAVAAVQGAGTGAGADSISEAAYLQVQPPGAVGLDPTVEAEASAAEVHIRRSIVLTHLLTT